MNANLTFRVGFVGCVVDVVTDALAPAVVADGRAPARALLRFKHILMLTYAKVAIIAVIMHSG